MGHSFKIGDRVLCVRGNRHLKEGCRYTIRSNPGSNWEGFFVSVEGIAKSGWAPERFVKVDSTEYEEILRIIQEEISSGVFFKKTA